MALQMYRLVKDDYNQDQAQIHYASTLDMIALSLFMKDGPSKEVEALLEHAKSTYYTCAQGTLSLASFLAVSVAMPLGGISSTASSEAALQTFKRFLIRLGSRTAMYLAGEGRDRTCSGVTGLSCVA